MTDETPETILELDRVTTGYGRAVVLSDVSLTVRRGELWFVLGPNGCGKTTLLRTILGVQSASSGTVRLAPQIASKERVGFVPQRCDLRPSMPMTVREFVRLGMVGVPGDAQDRAGRMEWALQVAGLPGMSERDYWSLSGGLRQRALVARALVRRPLLLLADEPTSALDLLAEAALLDTLAELHRKERLTVVLVTHDLTLARRYATHAALVFDGTVVSGTSAQMLSAATLQRAFGEAAVFAAAEPAR
ncbi:MAG TPA: ABC transporter ATP-binding protein [Candidatus Limnocylindrales bacterium]|nr:ABC transporter ATP-binding protein [Candidatus Limnocylindrales bacterium]